MVLAIDASTPVVAVNNISTVAAISTAVFTPPANSLLVILWSGNTVLTTTPGSTPTISDSLGAHLTYTQAQWERRSNTFVADGQTAIWTAPVVTSAAMSVTVTTGSTSGNMEAALSVQVLTDSGTAPLVGTSSKNGQNTGTTVAMSYTATATGSWGFSAVCDWATTGPETAGTGTTLIGSANVNTNAFTYAFFKRTTADGSSGVTTTLNSNLASASNNLQWAAVEVKSAGGGTTVAPTQASAQPGSTWKRRFQHRQERQLDPPAVIIPVSPWLPGMPLRRRPARLVPVRRMLSDVIVPDAGPPPVMSTRRRPTRRFAAVPFVESGTASVTGAQPVPPRVRTSTRRARFWPSRVNSATTGPISTAGTITSPYRIVVTTDAPTAWWHLDETSGTAFADAAGSNPFTITGAPTFGGSSLEGPGAVGTATSFSNAGLVFGEAAASPIFAGSAAGLTVEILAQPTAVNGNNRILELGADTSWALYFEGAFLKFNVFGHGTANYPWTGDTRRHHFVGTYDAATAAVRLFVDGIEVASQTTGGAGGTLSAGTNILRLAQKPTSVTGSDGWNGALDEAAIYAGPLSPTRVAAHAAAAGLGTPPRVMGRAARRALRLARPAVAVSPPTQAVTPTNPKISATVFGRTRATGRLMRRPGIDMPVQAQAHTPVRQTIRFRFVRPTARRSTDVDQWTPAQVNPPFDPSITKVHRFGFLSRRGHASSPVQGQQPAAPNPAITVTVFGRLRLTGRIQPRPKISNPTPAQQTATPNPRITATVFGRLRAVGRTVRRAEISTPIPAQVNPPIDPNVTKVRRFGAVARRARAASPVQAQQPLAPNPGITVTVFGRLRLVGRAQPRAKTRTPVPAQITAPNPPYAPRPSRVVAVRGFARSRPQNRSTPHSQAVSADRTTPVGGLRGLRRIWLTVRRKIGKPVPAQVTTLAGPVIVTDSTGTVTATFSSTGTTSASSSSSGAVTAKNSSSSAVTPESRNDGVGGKYDSNDSVQ